MKSHSAKSCLHGRCDPWGLPLRRQEFVFVELRRAENPQQSLQPDAHHDVDEERQEAKKEEVIQSSMEEAQERLKADQGLVKTPKVDTQGASGARRNFGDIEQAYINGEIGNSEYRKAREEQGL